MTVPMMVAPLPLQSECLKACPVAVCIMSIFSLCLVGEFIKVQSCADRILPHSYGLFAATPQHTLLVEARLHILKVAPLTFRHCQCPVFNGI